MGDPWKSITPKGVQAFVNATIATVIVWLTAENHISMIIEQLSAPFVVPELLHFLYII